VPGVGLGSRHLNVLVGLGNLLAMVAAGGIAAQGNLSAQAGVLMEGHTYKKKKVYNPSCENVERHYPPGGAPGGAPGEAPGGPPCLQEV